jgi:hypothetical protein
MITPRGFIAVTTTNGVVPTKKPDQLIAVKDIRRVQATPLGTDIFIKNESAPQIVAETLEVINTLINKAR